MQWRSILVSGCAVLLSAALALPVTAQTPPATTSDNVGFTRFAHTAVDVGPIDIYLGSNPQPIVSNLKYGDVTDFQVLSTDLSGYKVRAAGSPANSQPLFSLDWGVKGNKSELVIAAGLDSHKAFILEPLTMDRSDTKGSARVEVFNTVWGGATLGVDAVQGATFSQGQKYLDASPLNNLTPGTYNFEVKDGAGKVLATAPGIQVVADKIYTLLIMGSADGSTPIKLLPVVSDEATTRVQIVNQSGNAIDLYLKGDTKPFIANLANGTDSDWIALPSGSATIIMRNAGSSSTDKEVAALATELRPGRDATVTITAPDGKIQMNVTSEVLTAASTATMQATSSVVVAPMVESTVEPTPAG